MAGHSVGEEYLKPKQYYIDLYDLFTINDCLDTVRLHQDVYKKSLIDKKVEKISEEDHHRSFQQILNWHLYMTKGERYRNKKSRIQKWVDKNQIEQDKYDNTPTPQYFCSKCKEQLQSSFKTLENQHSEEPLRIMFFFRCKACKKGTGVYDNGEIHVSEALICPECGKEATYTHKKKGKTFTWTTKCTSCDYKKVDIDTRDSGESGWVKKKKKDKELLQKYREECCFTDKQGKEYIETIEALEYSKFPLKMKNVSTITPLTKGCLK